MTGQMSRAMLERYSHIRMAAKREAMAAITLRPVGGNSEVLPVKVPVATTRRQIQKLASCDRPETKVTERSGDMGNTFWLLGAKM